MSFRVRRVPPYWEHPRDSEGKFIPHYERFPFTADEIEELLSDGTFTNTPPHYGCNIMPQWPDSERTHYQMYECVNEGIPVSPPLESPERLARWLADNFVEVGEGVGFTYDEWLAVIRRGSSLATFAIDITTGETTSGVRALTQDNQKDSN